MVSPNHLVHWTEARTGGNPTWFRPWLTQQIRHVWDSCPSQITADHSGEESQELIILTYCNMMTYDIHAPFMIRVLQYITWYHLIYEFHWNFYPFLSLQKMPILCPFYSCPSWEMAGNRCAGDPAPMRKGQDAPSFATKEMGPNERCPRPGTNWSLQGIFWFVDDGWCCRSCIIGQSRIKPNTMSNVLKGFHNVAYFWCFAIDLLSQASTDKRRSRHAKEPEIRRNNLIPKSVPKSVPKLVPSGDFETFPSPDPIRTNWRNIQNSAWSHCLVSAVYV